MRPLCVDLDDTFLKTDSLKEILISALSKNPLRIFALALSLFKGRAFFKKFALNYSSPDIASLPIHEEVLTLVKSESKNGRKIILITGAHQKIADRVQEKYPLFCEAHGTSGSINLTGFQKATFLVERFGKEGFDYIGNSFDDIHVWRQAHGGWIVSHSTRFAASVLKNFPNKPLQVIRTEKNSFKQMIELIRPAQWTKNLLIFIPLLLVQKWTNKEILIQGMGAFLGFSIIASFVYILNDLLDITHDRKHPIKSLRPLASGAVSLDMGIFLTIALLSIFVLITAWLPFDFTAFVAAYVVLNFLYTFKIKKIFVLDAFVLTGFYSLRLLAGSAAMNIETSHWLIIFSTFFFLSLGFLKRYSDLLLVFEKNGQSQLEGRDYRLEDQQLLMISGVASGFVSILVFAQYIYGQQSIQYYPQPRFLWGVLLCMLYWITKIWFRASRGLVKDDPVRYALKDQESIILGITTLAFIIMAAWK